ncbi:unnamed protein product [Ixodes persulcatus]
MACSVSQPSSCRLKSDDIRMMVSGPLEAAQRMKGKPGSFQKRVADDSRGETATCISLNLVTCPAPGVKYEKREGGVSFWNNATVMQVFEDEAVVEETVSRFLRLHPSGCVSLFASDLDDVEGRCSQRGPAPRVTRVAHLLKDASVKRATANHGQRELVG